MNTAKKTIPLLFAVYAALLQIGYFLPGKLWSFSGFFYLPLGIQITLWLIFLSFIDEKTTRYFAGILSCFGDVLFKDSRKRIICFFIFVVFAFGACFLKSSHFLWGDSHMIFSVVHNFPDTSAYSIHSIVTIALYKVTSILIGWIGGVFGNGDILSWRISIYLWRFISAGFFGMFAYKLSSVVEEKAFNRILVFFGIAFSGAVLVFTHCEYYAPSLAVAIWALHVYLKNSSENSLKRYLFIIPAIVSTALYFPMAILLALLLNRFRRAGYIALASAILIAVLFWILSSVADMPSEQAFLPIADLDYFLSLNHLITYLNLILFASPTVLAILIIYPKNHPKSHLTPVVVVSLVMLFCLNLSFGGLDWDLAATLLLPLIILTALKLPLLPQRQSIIALMATLLLLFSWLYINVDNMRGLRRTEDILLRESSPYLKLKSPHERLAQIYFFNPNSEIRHSEIIRHCNWCLENEPFSEPPYSYLIGEYSVRKQYSLAANVALKALDYGIQMPKEYKRIASLAGMMYPLVSKKLDGKSIVKFEYDAKHVTTLLDLGNSDEEPPADWDKSLMELMVITLLIKDISAGKDFELAQLIFLAGNKLYPDNPVLLLNWGGTLIEMGRTNEARHYLIKAEQSGANRGNIQTNIALSYFIDGDDKSARHFFKTALEDSPQRFDFNYNYSYALYLDGHKEQALEVMEDYLLRAKYNYQRAKAQSALDDFKTGQVLSPQS